MFWINEAQKNGPYWRKTAIDLISWNHVIDSLFCISYPLFNRPGVATAVLQSPPWFIKWVSHPLLQISFKLCQSQTERARDLKFWENVHPTLCVLCHVSCVTCHVSRVTYHLSDVKIFFLHFFFSSFFSFFFHPKKIVQSGGPSWWRVCYQRGLPRLV